jgi:cytochrome c-type biogenesis protein CcmH
MKKTAAIIFLIATTQLVHAVQPDEILPDATLEARARTISRDLRCLVCQNQSIDDSDADMARDLRILVRDRIKAGDTDQQVMQHITDRFGNFVRLEPPVNGATLLLWLAPFLVLAVGGVMAARQLRGTPDTSKEPAIHEMSDEDRKIVSEYLDNK